MLARKLTPLVLALVLVLFSHRAEAAYGDVVINELFPDPSPAIGLPEEEFVEIFNTTNATINLAGWKLSDGTTTVTLASYDLPANGYLILCSTADVAVLSPFGPTLGVGSLPSLNNTGDNISLTDNTAVLTDFVPYTSAYYQDPDKDDGGYTLERINPLVGCSGLNNWRVSNATAGGTPGAQNSIYNTSTDNFQPVLLNVTVVNNSSILVEYNDAMGTNNVADAYSLDGGNISAVINSVPRNADTIVLDAAVDPGTVYILTISGRTNCAGLVLPDTSVLIALGVEGFFLDVVFTEVMADPTPAAGLPEAEFLEIFNRTEKPINLTGWDLTDGTGSVTLGNIVLLPGAYLALTTTSSALSFNSNTVKGISGFPSLTNEGEMLGLYNGGGGLVHTVTYSDVWHSNALKKDGGWSLEMIDKDNPCQETGNWTSSNATTGGTPGLANSVTGTTEDTDPPALLEAQVEDDTHLLAIFSEKLDPVSFSGAVFSASNGIGVISGTELLSPSLRHVRLTLDGAITAGTIYTLTVQNVFDCSGNEIGFQDTARFALAEAPEVGDLIINEVLFNPKTDGYDFVELYNASGKTLSTGSLVIAENDLVTGEITEFSNLTTTNKIIFPGDYLVLTGNSDVVKQQYFTPAPQAFLAVSGMPNYPDDEGIVSLLRAGDLEVLDELQFSNDWHFQLLDDEDGVSLERISIDRATQEQNNWHSAAQSVGFATPGYRNSSYLNPGGSDQLTLTPEVFSPDQDGFEDLLAIQYQFDQPGNLVNVYIFDTDGRKIRHLVKNETVGQEGFYTWDGLDEDGGRARIGIYIIVLEATDIKGGKVNRMKEKCVLAAKWN